MKDSTYDKTLGCFLGGAIGDALGAPIEFMSIGEIRYLFGRTGVRDYVEYPGGIGEFTDDTQMTLFTAEGLIRGRMRFHHRGICSAELVCRNAYIRWLRTQGEKVANRSGGIMVRPGSDWTQKIVESGWLITRKELFRRRSPGMTCLSALKSIGPDQPREPVNDSKGCGGVMRVAPVGLFWRGDAETAFRVGREAASITHGHPTGYLSAGVLAAIISLIVDGCTLREAIDAALKILVKEKNYQETLNAVNKALLFYKDIGQMSGANTEMPEILEKLGGGWIAEEALAIALLCSLVYQNDFESGVLAAVNHSGDSDSTGAITGNILGAIHGRENLPTKWIDRLKFNDIVIEIAEDFCDTNMDLDSKKMWNKYPGF
jgi:ADP-ribosylglycohydrolase